MASVELSPDPQLWKLVAKGLAVMPPGTVELSGVPRVGEGIELPETGLHYDVVSVTWTDGGARPFVMVR